MKKVGVASARPEARYSSDSSSSARTTEDCLNGLNNVFADGSMRIVFAWTHKVCEISPILEMKQARAGGDCGCLEAGSQVWVSH